jgi:hypothetical protein
VGIRKEDLMKVLDYVALGAALLYFAPYAAIVVFGFWVLCVFSDAETE